MNKTEAIVLILKQQVQTLSADEVRALNAWLAHDPRHLVVRERVLMLHHSDWRSMPSASAGFLDAQLQAVQDRIAAHQRHERVSQMRIRIAAVIVLAVMASLFIYFTTRPVLNSYPVHLSFSQTDLYHVADELENTYDVTVRVEDATTGTLRFSGMFVNATATDVLTALEKTLPVTQEYQNGLYILKGRK